MPAWVGGHVVSQVAVARGGLAVLSSQAGTLGKGLGWLAGGLCRPGPVERGLRKGPSVCLALGCSFPDQSLLCSWKEHQIPKGCY